MSNEASILLRTICDMMLSRTQSWRMSYFFSGRFDYTDPTICTVRLFDKISAPVKKLVWFERSAHFVFLEEPSRFAAEMRQVAEETKTFEGSRGR
jgi:hypothetical protein